MKKIEYFKVTKLAGHVNNFYRSLFLYPVTLAAFQIFAKSASTLRVSYIRYS